MLLSTSAASAAACASNRGAARGGMGENRCEEASPRTSEVASSSASVKRRSESAAPSRAGDRSSG